METRSSRKIKEEVPQLATADLVENLRKDRLEELLEQWMEFQLSNSPVKLVEGRVAPKLLHVFDLKEWIKQAEEWLIELVELNESLDAARVLRYGVGRLVDSITINLSNRREIKNEVKEEASKGNISKVIKEVESQIINDVIEEIQLRAMQRMNKWINKPKEKVLGDAYLLMKCNIPKSIIISELAKVFKGELDQFLVSDEEVDLEEMLVKLEKLIKLRKKYFHGIVKKDTESKGKNKFNSKGMTVNRSPLTCFKCKEVGHTANKCKNNKGVNGIRDHYRDLIMNFMIEERPVKMLVDTGAARSFISERCIPIEKKKEIRQTADRFTTVNGEPLKVKGSVELKTMINEKEVKHTFFIVEDLKYEGIIGLDWLTDAGVTIDVRERTLIFKQPSSNENKNQNVASIQRIEEEFSDVIVEEIDLNNGAAKVEPVVINIKDPQNPPTFVRNFNLGVNGEEVLWKEVQNMLKAGVIEEAKSHEHWNFPAILVKKKDGTWRVCIDFRKLNERTITIPANIPRIEDLLDLLSRYNFFTKIDLIKGYWQIPIAEESKKYLTFTCKNKRYQFCTMPFGITNAPAIFQQYIEEICSEVGNSVNLIDDIIIYGQTLEEIEDFTKKMFKVLREKNLKVSKKKTVIGRREVQVFGFRITDGKIYIDEEKKSIMKEMRFPKNKKEMESFLGFCNYFRRFIPRFGELESTLRCFEKDNKKNDNQKIEESFVKMKEEILNSSPLWKFEIGLKTIVRTDASDSALGAILFQVDKDQNERVISFDSRKLKKHQKGYSTIERELQAIYNGLKRFRPYLLTQPFVLQVDHKPLVSILEKKDCNLSPKWTRRLLEISCYDFKIEYVPGKLNREADFLSRAINAIRIEVPNLKTLQENDVELSKIEIGSEGFFKENGILKKQLNNGGSAIVLPTALRRQAMKEAHSEGHLGFKKSFKRLESNFFWSGMGRDLKEFIEGCDLCQRFNPARQVVTETQHLEAKSIWTDLAIDCMGPFELVEIKIHVLVVIDMFSKFMIARIIHEPNSQSIIRVLREIFYGFGAPNTVLSDNATNFTSQEMSVFFAYWGVKHKRTTAYNPQGNGIVERAIQTLKRSFVKLLQVIVNPEEALVAAVSTYNNSFHRNTKMIPFELIFKRKMKTPLRRALDIENNLEDGGEEEWNENEVRDNLEEAQGYQDQYLRLRRKIVESMKFKVGDKVLILKEVRRSNLDPRYYGPFTIKEKVGPNVYLLEENNKLVSTRRMKRFRFQESPLDLDWSNIELDMQENEVEPEWTSDMIGKVKRELMVVVDRYYSGGSSDMLITDLNEYGKIGDKLIKKIVIKGKPQEYVVRKIWDLREEDFY